ncbi:hypothetical protein Bca101_035551 [Brassica carinata]
MARNYFNTIHELTDINGTAATTPEAVGLLAVHHFASVLGPPLTIAAPNLQQQVRQATKAARSQEMEQVQVFLSTITLSAPKVYNSMRNQSQGSLAPSGPSALLCNLLRVGTTSSSAAPSPAECGETLPRNSDLLLPRAIGMITCMLEPLHETIIAISHNSSLANSIHELWRGVIASSTDLTSSREEAILSTISSTINGLSSLRESIRVNQCVHATLVLAYLRPFRYPVEWH